MLKFLRFFLQKKDKKICFTRHFDALSWLFVKILLTLNAKDHCRKLKKEIHELPTI